MSILKVAKLGNPVLRAVADPVPLTKIKEQEIQRLIRDMVETMREYGGVGLAAPQVHCCLQIVVIEALDPPDGTRSQKPSPLEILINPSISALSDQVEEDWEGCLSIPDLRGRVPRCREIRVQAYDPQGVKLDFVASCYRARVIQHEHDHLMGKIFLDRMQSLNSLTYLKEFSRYWQEENEK